MLTFRMDETNFDQGTRQALRIAEGLGLKIDFDEFSPDADALSLWHLHDGACASEGTGLEDEADGHDFTNHGAESVEVGYRFDQADGDYLDAAYPGQSERSQVTLEIWSRNWETPTDATGAIAMYAIDTNTYLFLLAKRHSTPSLSYIGANLTVDGVTVGRSTWVGADADGLLAADAPWHMAVVLDSPNRLTLYVNGVTRAEDSTDIVALPAGDYTLRLGRWISGWTGYDLSADLDEVRLSSVARYTTSFTPHRLLVSGEFTSPTFDAIRLAADWADLAHASSVPDGCGLAWEVRAADETDAGGAPQALWQDYTGDPQTLPDGRYFQWRATLSADEDRLTSPTVESVEAVASEAGYDLFLTTGTGPDALDYTDPWRRLGPGVTEIETDALAAPAIYWFGIRPVDADGRQSPITQSEVRLELDAEGEAFPDRPAAPLALHAEPLPDAQVRLRWRYRVGCTGAEPEVFRIFGDGGTGTIDYETPLGEVDYVAGRTWHVWTSPALAPGVEHQLAVRAIAEGDVWDESPAVVQATPDATPPDLVDALNAEILL